MTSHPSSADEAERRSGIHSPREEFDEDLELPLRSTTAPCGYGSGLALQRPGTTAVGRRQLAQPAAYCFASAACSTALQAAGICASVIGGFGFGGSGGGLGCSTASLNQ